MNTQVIEFLKANPNSNKGQIADAVNLRGLGLFNLLKKMVSEGQITVEGEGHDATYSVSLSAAAPIENSLTETSDAIPNDCKAAEETVENPTEQEVAEVVETKQKTIKKQTGRSTGTYNFNNVSYNKGKLIHAVVSAHVTKNDKISLDKLREAFPDNLMKRFGIFQTVEKAREISGPKYDRYFFKEEMQIKLKHAIIVTCNQITGENILPFLQRCRELGYVIEAE